MIDYSIFNKIYFSTDTNLFRGGIPSFQIKVRAFFDEDEIKDNLFVFVNKNIKQIKLYYEDDKGTWLSTYRLRKGRFKIDLSTSNEYSLTVDELRWIINGLSTSDFEKIR